MPVDTYRTLLLGLLFLLVFPLPGKGGFPFRHLTKKEGLSQNSVIAITQDGKGYLWFGTRDGLNRYDGHEFRVYRRQKNKANSLAFNHAHSLYYDTERDWLWVGTTRGLCRYRQETDDFVTYGAPESLQHGFIHFTYRDRSGILWVGTDEGLFRHQPEDDSFFRLAGLPTQAYRVMAEDSSGQLLVGTPAGVFKIALSSALDRVSLSPLFPGGTDTLTPYVQDILPGPQGEIWIATRFSGLLRWVPGQDQPRRFHTGGDARHRLSNDNVRALAWGRDGSLWAGTFVGLNRLAPGSDAFEFQHEDPDDGEVFLSHSIHSLFVDQRGSLWVGSYYGGVALYDEVLASIQRYPSRGGDEKIGVVGTFTNGPRGVMWVGSEGTGVHAFVRGRGVTSTYDSQDGLAGNNAKSLLYQDGELWIGFYQAGLCRLNLATGEARCNEDLLPPYLLKKVHNVYGLLLRKDTLWLSDYGQGITWLDTRTGQGGNLRHQENGSNSLLANQCNYLIDDSSGQLWVATSHGVSRLQLRPGGQPRFTNYLHGKIVHTLQEDKDGRIWAGTYGQGLFVIDPATGKTEHLTDADLEESTIYGIVRDAADRLWVTTNQGIYHQDPRSGRFRNFGGSGDLDEQEYGKNALIRDPSGALFFGGTGGITSFKPADLPTDVYHPPLVFTELRVANQTVAIDPDNGILQRAIDGTTELELPYNNANFSLSFASLDFLSPQSNRYEYKLDGVDEDWVSTRGATAASYTLQDAGSYRFRVRSFRGDERMPIAERELLVNVLPPPWRSWYAYLLYALVVGLAIAAAVRYTYLRHELKLEQAAKDQQEALHQAKLRFFTNITHELRTPLTLMLGPLESIRRSGEVKGPAAERLWSVEKNSRRLLDLVNQLLSFRKLSGERENLNLDGRDVVEFSRDVTHSFRELAREREITLRYQSKEAHVELNFDADKIEKVLYNLLANAFKFTPPGGRVELGVRREGPKVYFRVSDTGEGIPASIQEEIFARFFERKSLTRREGSGIGLAIVREYVEMHGGEITVNSTPGMGSTFQFWIPLRPVLMTSAAEDPWVSSPPPTTEDADRELLLPAATNEPPPLVLIVEDNLEVRDYIESVLLSDYRLATAENGKEGLEKARNLGPELVLSDVMMPEMDGISFCAALKEDLRTSHIPLILLTANSTDLQKLHGLETGADDYLTKPFSPRELQLRIRNILRSVKLARQKAANTLRLDPGEVQVTPADTKFLEKAIALVNLHMDDTRYKVDDFARDLAVSRALLFTKMKAITDHTPNGFIKMLRMKRAAQLLQTRELNVAEVAGRVGYRDVKYFSKSFRVAYGCPPSVYGEIAAADGEASRS